MNPTDELPKAYNFYMKCKIDRTLKLRGTNNTSDLKYEEFDTKAQDALRAVIDLCLVFNKKYVDTNVKEVDEKEFYNSLHNEAIYCNNVVLGYAHSPEERMKAILKLEQLLQTKYIETAVNAPANAPARGLRQKFDSTLSSIRGAFGRGGSMSKRRKSKKSKKRRGTKKRR
jgi:hypothetical protein